MLTNKFLTYSSYVARHKWYVFLECKKYGLWFRGIFYDNSKFRPSEFFAYAEKFFSGDYAYKYSEVEHAFEKAWLHHEHRNGHHWGYWVNSKGRPLRMPRQYIIEMICDWKAMGRRFNDTAREFYEKDKGKMILHEDTIKELEDILDVKTI